MTCALVCTHYTALQITARVNECDFSAHMMCLAKHMLQHCQEEHRCIPVESPCPRCNRPMLWGNLVRWMDT